MSTTIDTKTAAPAASFASSTAFRNFAITFGIATPVIYVICEMANWPLFSYYPAVNQIAWGYSPGSDDLGPAMHWYGWTANTMIAAGVLGLLATQLPDKLVKKIPLALVWILPALAVLILIYSLRFYWRW
jgi:hypothetical membrane protein